MKKRCYNPNTPQWSDYGGRGITVCDRWVNSFENFLADMGPRPSSKHSIDRIDNDGPYSPENCRWATRKEQNNNSRHNRRITFHGETRTLYEWAAVIGIRPSTLIFRLQNWSLERALTEPVHR